MTRVLIADDAPDIITILQTGLNRHGFEVHHASNGRDALAIILAGTVDIAILDVRMPEMNGLEVLQALQQHQSAHIPILLLSANVTEQEIARGLHMGATRYLIKPFKIAEVVAAIQQSLPGSGVTTETQPGHD